MAGLRGPGPLAVSPFLGAGIYTPLSAARGAVSRNEREGLASPVAVNQRFGDTRAATGCLSEAYLVGVTGFEPATPCTPCRCATKLRHTPTIGRIT